jgi:hypothetical protein
MTTLRQIEANRRNSAHSTGPRSEAGKERSRANSLKHGLTGAGVVLPAEEAEAVLRRAEEWSETFEPESSYGRWLAGQVALESVRVDACQKRDLAIRINLVERARTRWEHDRRLAAESLGAGLARQPSLVACRLQETSQGCDWLIERWRGLLAAVEQLGRWTEAHRDLALDLLGTPPDLRDVPGRLETADEQADAAREAIETLTRHKAIALDDLDEIEQEAAVHGTPIVEDRALARLRRYESACHRNMQRALRQLPRLGKASADSIGRKPVDDPDDLAGPGDEEQRAAAEWERQKDLQLAAFDAQHPRKTFTELVYESLQAPAVPAGSEPKNQDPAAAGPYFPTMAQAIEHTLKTLASRAASDAGPRPHDPDVKTSSAPRRNEADGNLGREDGLCGSSERSRSA